MAWNGTRKTTTYGGHPLPAGHHHPLHFDNRSSLLHRILAPVRPIPSDQPRGWPHGGGQIYPKTAHPDRLKFGQPSKSHCRMKVFPVLCFLALLTWLNEWRCRHPERDHVFALEPCGRGVSSPVSSVPPGQEQEEATTIHTVWLPYPVHTLPTTYIPYYYATDPKSPND
ncbi:hypothetical protein B0T20DRAFT_406032 [Sordaria brevicollis]|uniref:Uncharacterized protein n=1 Tax=Sordaria brevicollis TaxID=83679 RepID=A0AAE0UF51_SORBR|nr:hypothetical protein B0T20DRAFT_406032 [Sordaria brevicollis]